MTSVKDLLNFLEKTKTFTDFEKKLANLLSDKEKGDIFELFCQFYLKVIYKKQAFKSIQLFKDIDITTLQRLNLRLSKDYGIDIVATTDSDDLWTIQVKFRQSDQLTWTELSTFRASSEKANFTMVMSNVSKINHPHTVLNDFSSILRNEFEALTEEDFLNIQAVINGLAIKQTVFSPRPHQVEAIESALNHFKTNNLGQMIHACGTGKTLTSLWIKEALKPKNTIVYVPSLSLLKQILEEWTKHKSSSFSIKCVCSEQSISGTAQELDESILDITELGVPVTTNHREIAEFLKSTYKDKIIFSTYQSALVVNEAVKLLPQFSFDFGVFDEAHRTASKKENLFAKCLSTPVKKKLFMTATPKLYAPHLQSRAKEENILLCSMDDSLIYGKPFHEIKFGQAIKLNLLSDYKIKIITVTNDEIKELIDRRFYIDLLGKEITADELAKVWALLKSFNETNHVISFHSRIHGAKEFQSLVEKTIELFKNNKTETEDVKTYHISGEYPTYQRSKILSEFIAQKKSLVTNARCLTEGVDVPAIDGVYFVDPKQNIIDIVQAVGRAIRKKPTKYGYIIIPVFIKDEADIEKIIESSAFRQVWDVVEAMKDQDARLSHIIEELQELKGKKRFGSLKSRDQAEERASKADLGNIFDLSDSILPKNINLLEFVEQISVKTLDVVGQSWDEKFGEYKAFKEKYNYEPSQNSKVELERSIQKWAGHQRTAYNKNKLSQDKIDKLNSISFIWNQFEQSWEKSFKEYKEFKEKYNREPNGNSEDESENSLAGWISQQRIKYNVNKLSKEKIERLNSIGFTWDVHEFSWSETFNGYQEFKGKYNREPLGTSKVQSEKLFAQWAGDQRKRYKINKLSKDRIKKLNSLNFIWNFSEKSWGQSFKEYKEFKEKYNREPNGNSEDESEQLIASWISNQRTRYKINKLSKERENKLDSIGFVWDTKGDLWEKSFKEYKEFKEKYNREPSGSSRSWAYMQRQKYGTHEISKERVERLNSINFNWDPLESSWNEAFYAYKLFKKKHNREPSNHAKDKKEQIVASWTTTQRTRYEQLSKERKDRLQSIGFVWDVLESSWSKAFNDYKTFKEKHNREPLNRSKDAVEKFLAKWIGTQRDRYNKHKISQDRIDKLSSINFNWDPLESSWNQTFKEYKEFKEKYGKEPYYKSKIEKEKFISQWISDQRERYKKNKLSRDRIEKLNAIGFKWHIWLKRVNGRFVSN